MWKTFSKWKRFDTSDRSHRRTEEIINLFMNRYNGKFVVHSCYEEASGIRILFSVYSEIPNDRVLHNLAGYEGVEFNDDQADLDVIECKC